MAWKYNPFSGELDYTMGPGGGTASIDFSTDSGSASPTALGVITFTGGAGISTSASGNTVTITSTSAGAIWTVVTAATQALAVDNGYIGNRATTITYTLPATAAVGDMIELTNIGVGLPVIAQNAGDYINFTSSTTTSGIVGSLTAIDQFSSIVLVCTVANSAWNVLSSTGNWSIS